MNGTEFKTRINSLNQNSWGFGNEVLYLMTKDPRDIKNKDKLEGTIWLIGRAYSASPQRRNYGKKCNPNGKKCPIWPIKTQNDGREGFFGEVAKQLDTSCLDSLINDYHKKSLAYKYDLTVTQTEEKKKDGTVKTITKSVTLSDEDKDLLINSIVAVLSFNQALSRSIEKFDRVPNNRSDIKCNNHISFSSKYLHFYFPNVVFIVDSFAYNGGCYHFNGNDLTKIRYLEEILEKNKLEKSVYDDFNKTFGKKSFVNEIIEGILRDVQTKLSTLQSENNAENDKEIKDSNDNDDKLTNKNYIAHCVRSYLLGVYLKNNNIVPHNVILSDKTLCPMPRLTDTVFLNIKKDLTAKEKDYQKVLDDIYYNPQKT